MPVRYGLPSEEFELCCIERAWLLHELSSIDDVLAGFAECPRCGRVHRCTAHDPVCECDVNLT